MWCGTRSQPRRPSLDVAWPQLATLLQLFLIAVLIADYVAAKPSIIRPVLWAYSLSAAVTALVGIQSYLQVGLAVLRGQRRRGAGPGPVRGNPDPRPHLRHP